MTSHYEINVTLNGQHLFATAERSIQNEADLLRVFPAIRLAFRDEDGYSVTVTVWEVCGTTVEVPA